jgi:hypothetical protein
MDRNDADALLRIEAGTTMVHLPAEHGVICERDRPLPERRSSSCALLSGADSIEERVLPVGVEVDEQAALVLGVPANRLGVSFDQLFRPDAVLVESVVDPSPDVGREPEPICSACEQTVPDLLAAPTGTVVRINHGAS